MNKDTFVRNKYNNIVCVGNRTQCYAYLKYHAPDGEYSFSGPGVINYTLYVEDGISYPTGGIIDNLAIPSRSPEEAVAFFSKFKTFKKRSESNE